MSFSKGNVFDLAALINPNLVVYPDDPRFAQKSICEIGDQHQSCFGLQEYTLCNHAGTHIDFPKHVNKEGKDAQGYHISHLMGVGHVIDFSQPGGIPAIKRDMLEKYPQSKQSGFWQDKIIFFKTSNSQLDKHPGQIQQLPNYVSLEPDAASFLVEQGVRIVGIDYISVDNIDDKHLPTHHALLDNGVLIVENLELKHISAASYIFYIMPLNVEGADGVPARVVAVAKGLCL